jgi:hypothetical protein
MTALESHREIKWISPGFWMIPSLVLFAICVVYPPERYTEYLGDRNYIFLNPRAVGFTLLCVASTLIGMATYSRLFPLVNESDCRQSRDLPQPGLTEVALACVLICGNLYVLRVLWHTGLLSSFLDTVRGHEQFGLHFETTITTLDPANLSSISLASVAFLPWLYHVCLNARGRLVPRDRLVLAVLFWGLFLTYAATVTPLGRRNELMRPILGIFLVWFLHRSLQGRMTRKLVLTMLSAFVAFGLSLFVVVWIARSGALSGAVDTDELYTETLGYCVAPYNQQAALIDGVLKFPGTGKGFNWCQWLWKFPVLQNFVDPQALLGELPPYGVYERLEALKANGFEPRYTALSAFGNSYVDFGWFGFLPFLLYGFVGAFTWRRFVQGEPAGLLIYPMFAYSILEWRANLLFPPRYMGQILIILAAVVIGRSCEQELRRKRSRPID